MLDTWKNAELSEKVGYAVWFTLTGGFWLALFSVVFIADSLQFANFSDYVISLIVLVIWGLLAALPTLLVAQMSVPIALGAMLLTKMLTAIYRRIT